MAPTVFYFILLLLWPCVHASALAPAAAALAPRASAIAFASYRPPWQCPASYTAGSTIYPVIATTVRTATYNAATVNVFDCQISIFSCLYNLATGLVQPNMPEWCGKQVQPNTGCAYECPLSNGIATDSFLAAFTQNRTMRTGAVIDQLICYYGAGTQTGVDTSYDASCTYDFVTGKITAAGTSKISETCLGPLTLDCGSTTTRRRRYRQQDNFTAQLARKALRESQRAALPEPAQRPNPLIQRILG
ncbi:hypothetical protein MSAN_00492900 [Mycena sanguinolenta]|uniref:Uncharacterized protein n=1 Tax=Mycena sanguinolenta TaxID=230812 RepID=A0A8H7DHX0_9AGAR|nr:hypothetical protein MSAN_00492900 [Mycena sanguinolenta]